MLLAALARRLLTPPPAAGRADSEGERGGRREDGASPSLVLPPMRPWLPGASGPDYMQTGPRSGRLTLPLRPAPGP